MSDLSYWVAFARIPSVGRVRFGLLEQKFGSLEAAWQASARELESAGLDRHAISAITWGRSHISPQEEIERMERAGVRAITWRDEGYPPLLREIYDLPPVLFIKGGLLPEDRRSVAVVGTRNATAYGREAATYLAGDLARNGVTIVSGLARGIDAVAHRAALEAGGRTIAVVASGLDMVYPPEHTGLAQQVAEQGALVSEYPLGTRPEARHFPRRNRLLSGMTLGTLVIEAPEKSGALWTVRHALEQNREVFCVPGSVFSPASRATNLLIQEGAKLVLDFKDVLEELNLSAVTQQMELPGLLVPEGDTEAKVLQCLGYEPIHIDDVGRRSGLPIAAVSSTLAMMEIKGLVRSVGAMNFVRTREAAAGYAAVE
ncbi:MAG: DNA-protecting protein DprA [Chloroflexi bacterium]|nr:DNA-protecting protein DprA [Chloroflexota bacterium]